MGYIFFFECINSCFTILACFMRHFAIHTQGDKVIGHTLFIFKKICNSHGKSLRVLQPKDVQTFPECFVTEAAVKLKVSLLAGHCCLFK